MNVLSECMSVHHVCLVPSTPEKGTSSSGTPVLDFIIQVCACTHSLTHTHTYRDAHTYI